MEEIKKAIEEERNEAYNNASNRCPYEGHEYHIYRSGYDSGIDRGIEIVLSKWEESTRWRKVEDELPACEDDLVIVKVRNKNKEDGIFLYDICYIDEETNTWGKRHHTWEDIIEWKPIH